MSSPVIYTAVKAKPLQVSNLVFVDLETTGLPSSHHKVRITELCFCSVERDHFLSSRSQIPRVTNRLNLCLYPGRMIDLKATELTQLDNYNLQKQSRFDENVFKMISSFLNRLQPPVCLIAHNGTKFDFPILKAEIANLGMKLGEDLLCVDSLSIFKILDEIEEVNQIHLSDDLNSSTSSTSSLSPSASDRSTEGNRTSLATPIKSLNLVTPEKNEMNCIPHVKDKVSSTFHSPNCKKNLAFEKSPSPTKKPKLDLTSIYERLHNRKPVNAHAAESDVYSLLSSAIKVAPKFLEFVDQLANTFDSVPKSW